MDGWTDDEGAQKTEVTPARGDCAWCRCLARYVSPCSGVDFLLFGYPGKPAALELGPASWLVSVTLLFGNVALEQWDCPAAVWLVPRYLPPGTFELLDHLQPEPFVTCGTPNHQCPPLQLTHRKLRMYRYRRYLVLQSTSVGHETAIMSDYSVSCSRSRRTHGMAFPT